MSSFSIGSRQIITTAERVELDAKQTEAADLQYAVDSGRPDASPRALKNALARYRRACARISGTRYTEHYYTESGLGIVSGHAEVYFGQGVE